jgi:hypothetical protein
MRPRIPEDKMAAHLARKAAPYSHSSNPISLMVSPEGNVMAVSGDFDRAAQVITSLGADVVPYGSSYDSVAGLLERPVSIQPQANGTVVETVIAHSGDQYLIQLDVMSVGEGTENTMMGRYAVNVRKMIGPLHGEGIRGSVASTLVQRVIDEDQQVKLTELVRRDLSYDLPINF